MEYVNSLTHCKIELAKSYLYPTWTYYIIESTTKSKYKLLYPQQIQKPKYQYFFLNIYIYIYIYMHQF